jgi:AcrR family transcriptional regulator
MQKIVNAAMMLIQENGFDGTTMEQIAEEADRFIFSRSKK